MKNTLVLVCTLLTSLIVNSTVDAAFLEDGIDKAAKLITIERYDAAHRLIEDEILKDPESSKNFYRAGLLYLRMDWTTQADRCFNDSTIVNKSKKYKGKVAKIFQARALIKVGEGEIESASLLFTNAHALNLGLKSHDTASLMSYGKEYLERGQEDRAYPNFKVAQKIDPQLGGEISDLYYDACENIKNPCLPYYRRAKEFSTKNNPRIAQLLFSLYSVDGIYDQHKKTLKNEIRLYVSKVEYRRIFQVGWTAIHEEKFTGIGYTGGVDGKGGVLILTHGINVQSNNRVVVIGKNVETWYGGKYVPTHNNKFDFANKMRKQGGKIGARAPLGESFTVTVKTYKE